LVICQTNKKDLLKVEQNISRLKYLLTLYKMTVEDLLLSVSEGLNKPLTKGDILSNEIKVSHLKRIDKVFNKGLHYYLDPKFPEVSKDASIFFRKNKFGTELTIGAKKIVNQFEEFKISLSAISKLADINIDRSLPVFSVQDDSKVVAIKIRKNYTLILTRRQKSFYEHWFQNLPNFANNKLSAIERWCNDFEYYFLLGDIPPDRYWLL